MKLFNADCLDVLPTLPDNSVDMVMADPPYGTTQCKWDSIIPLEPLWKELKRVTKKRGAIVMTASQPFTTTLIASNMKMFRYTWVWDKKKAGNFYLAKYMPLKTHEDVCVFYQAAPTYNPQRVMRTVLSLKRNPVGIEYKRSVKNSLNKQVEHANLSLRGVGSTEAKDGTKNPITIIEISNGGSSKELGKHPTQKPVALMEYLIKTYTNEGDTVLDFCMGSGSTGVACVNLGRDFIGIEKDTEHGYFDIAQQRISEARANQLTPLFGAAD